MMVIRICSTGSSSSVRREDPYDTRKNAHVEKSEEVVEFAVPTFQDEENSIFRLFKCAWPIDQPAVALCSKPLPSETGLEF